MVERQLQVRNSLPPGQISPPVTTPPRADRPSVVVAVEWDDGRRADVAGTAVSWTADAVLVAFSGPDGRGRQAWFPSPLVQRL